MARTKAQARKGKKKEAATTHLYQDHKEMFSEGNERVKEVQAVSGKKELTKRESDAIQIKDRMEDDEKPKNEGLEKMDREEIKEKRRERKRERKILHMKKRKEFNLKRREKFREDRRERAKIKQQEKEGNVHETAPKPSIMKQKTARKSETRKIKFESIDGNSMEVQTALNSFPKSNVTSKVAEKASKTTTTILLSGVAEGRVTKKRHRKRSGRRQKKKEQNRLARLARLEIACNSSMHS